MSRAIKTILILILAVIIGLYLGFKDREVEVVVYEQNGTTATSTANGTTTTFTLQGEQLGVGGFLEDFFGKDFQNQWPSLPWYLSRAAAIAAYLLMFIIIVLGVGMVTGFIYKLTNPVEAWTIHKYLSISLGIMLLVHIFSLLFDEFINFNIRDVLIPFLSDFKTVYLSLGIIAFYLLLIVIATSLLLRLRTPRLWRLMHYAVYPMFALTLIHGIFTGTDSKNSLTQIMYWTTGSIVLIVLLYRLFYHSLKNKTS